MKKSAGGISPALRCLQGDRLPDAIGSLAARVLEGLNLEPQLLAQGSGDEAANAMRLPAGLPHEVGQCCTAGTFQQGNNLPLFCVLSACVLVLLAGRLPGASSPLRRDVAAVFAGDQALGRLPDPRNSHGAVRKPLPWKHVFAGCRSSAPRR